MGGEYHAYSPVPTADEESAKGTTDNGDTAIAEVKASNADVDTGENKAEKEARFQEMIGLRNEVGRLEDLMNQAQKNLDNLRGFWGGKEKDLKHTLEDLLRQQASYQDQLVLLEKVDTGGAENLPLGPKSLYWVKGGRFTTLCSLVVICNLATMLMEIMHPHYKHDFFYLDQAVLVFYILEIVLKLLLFRRELLCGPCSISWWNWLDVIIVTAGIADQWLKPLLPSSGDAKKSSTIVQVIKMLRIARLARILKTVRAFLQSDLSWAEGKSFQLFIMGTIAANSLIMSFESDFPDFAGWFYVEQTLLLIFSFELLVRMRRWGCRFFYHESDLVWNWLDFIIVFGGIIDQWLMPAASIVEELLGIETHSEGSSNMGQIMTTLRMARLLRILRLVRLVKNIPPLFTLIVGILQAMQGMAWVLVLTAVFLYAFALLSVRLVGHGLLFGGRAPPEVAEIFPSVPQSMFVLFKVMNGDLEPVEPLFQALPISKLGFVLYMVVSSWAILSILTAVVSENMIQATEHHRNELEEEQAFTKDKEVREYLGKLFADIDKDGSNELGEEEFEEMLSDKSICSDLFEKTGLQIHDLEQIFEFLMCGGKVSRSVFIDALQSESRPVTERTIFRLEKRLIDVQTSFENHIKDLADKEAVAHKVDEAHGKKMEQEIESDHLLLAQLETRRGGAGVGGASGMLQVPSNGFSQQMGNNREPNAGCTAGSSLIQQPPMASVPEQVRRKDLEDRLLPFQVALQIIEHRLDGIALESNVDGTKSCIGVERLEWSSTVQREASCEALLVKLEESLGMTRHNVRSSLQSILGKMDSHLKTMQQISIVEPVMRKFESQLQAHQQSTTDLLVATIEKKLGMSQLPSLQSEMNRGASAVQTSSALEHQFSFSGMHSTSLLHQGPAAAPSNSSTPSMTPSHFENSGRNWAAAGFPTRQASPRAAGSPTRQASPGKPQAVPGLALSGDGAMRGMRE